jgi:hypothetical protein
VAVGSARRPYNPRARRCRPADCHLLARTLTLPRHARAHVSAPPARRARAHAAPPCAGAAPRRAAPTRPLPLLIRRYDIDLRDDRELALRRLTSFCRAGFVSVTDFRSAVPPSRCTPALCPLTGGRRCCRRARPECAAQRPPKTAQRPPKRGAASATSDSTRARSSGARARRARDSARDAAPGPPSPPPGTTPCASLRRTRSSRSRTPLWPSRPRCSSTSSAVSPGRPAAPAGVEFTGSGPGPGFRMSWPRRAGAVPPLPAALGCLGRAASAGSRPPPPRTPACTPACAAACAPARAPARPFSRPSPRPDPAPRRAARRQAPCSSWALRSTTRACCGASTTWTQSGASR